MKWKKILSIFLLIIVFFPCVIQANTDILEEQKSSLHISDFIKEANSYSK